MPVACCTTAEFIGAFLDGIQAIKAAQSARPLFVTYLNAWCSNIAGRDPEYAQILRNADAVYADGQAIVWASRILGSPLPERVNAADFILDFCREAARRHVSVHLLGSANGVAAKAADTFLSAAPSLHITGADSGYFHDNKGEILRKINSSAPDLLILGLGVPMQEKWAMAHLEELNVRAIWCVGAMFEYHGKARARAPVWIRKAGLEWLFRLVLEPGRLWRRYLVGNCVFLHRLVSARIARSPSA
ncbi:MAG: WecB/TagA/CpsF family glycosyltransferase [Candidatus Sumerlaeaceae bacterium]|nr:WecB/TagA/CpsF family glycosyltransferase [Candidatus Sumerlaeaceae bacterium]